MIPLLIEGNMQDIFSKIIIVYLSPDVQTRRLMNRDGISEDSAKNILKAQLPIDKKLNFADYVISNENTIDETGANVEKVWQSIRNCQDNNMP